MKTKKLFFTAALLIGVSVINVFSQNIGINDTGSNPNGAAGLDIDKTNQGLLVPRVALTQKNSNAPIGATIANSLLVYNTATVNDVSPGYYFWNATAGKWESLLTTSTGCSGCTTVGWTLVGVANTNIGNTGWVGAVNASAAPYYVPAGKEVLAVAFVSCGSEVTVYTTDNVGVIEYQGSVSNANYPGGAAQVMLDSPNFTGTHAYTSASYNQAMLISAHILTRNWNSDTTPATLVSSNGAAGACWISPGVQIGLSGNGMVWMYDPDASYDFSMYVFER